MFTQPGDDSASPSNKTSSLSRSHLDEDDEEDDISSGRYKIQESDIQKELEALLPKLQSVQSILSPFSDFDCNSFPGTHSTIRGTGSSGQTGKFIDTEDKAKLSTALLMNTPPSKGIMQTPTTNGRGLTASVRKQVIKSPATSRVDAFLLALHRAGYSNLEHYQASQTPHGLNKEGTGLTDFSYKYFFSSALNTADDPSSPLPSGQHSYLDHPLLFHTEDEIDRRYSPTEEEYVIQKLNTLIFPSVGARNARNRSNEEWGDFTAASLKKNWDLEEEFDEKIEKEIVKVIEAKKLVIESNGNTNATSATSAGMTSDEVEEDEVEDDSFGGEGKMLASIEAEEVEEDREEHDLDFTDHGQNPGTSITPSLARKQVTIVLPTDNLLSPSSAYDSDTSYSANSPMSCSRDDSYPNLSYPTTPSASSAGQTMFTATTPLTAGKRAASFGDDRDSRLDGDFIVYARGKMLCPDYSIPLYTGLQETPEISHYLAPATSSTPTTGFSGYDNTLQHNQTNANRAKVLPVRRHLSGSNTGTGAALSAGMRAAGGNSGVESHYASHILECVIRPDIELKDYISLLTTILREWNSLHRINLPHRNHIVVTWNLPSNSSGHNQHSQGVTREYDRIDLQIAISRQLRQRVLIIQFLRRLTSTTMATTQALLRATPHTAQQQSGSLISEGTKLASMLSFSSLTSGGGGGDIYNLSANLATAVTQQHLQTSQNQSNNNSNSNSHSNNTNNSSGNSTSNAIEFQPLAKVPIVKEMMKAIKVFPYRPSPCFYPYIPICRYLLTRTSLFDTI